VPEPLARNRLYLLEDTESVHKAPGLTILLLIQEPGLKPEEEGEADRLRKVYRNYEIKTKLKTESKTNQLRPTLRRPIPSPRSRKKKTNKEFSKIRDRKTIRALA